MIFTNDLIKKRILVVGSNGMLGQRTVEHFFSNDKVELLACSKSENVFGESIAFEKVDLTNREGIKKVILNFYPDFIINCSAFTNVDLSETERETAWKVNVKGVEYISEAARVIDAQIIHISTDYVFDGLKGPYAENANVNPISYYGRTKLASENALKISGTINTILRTNVLYGHAKYGRPDFVRWVYNSLSDKKEIKIVTDQFNNPTFIDDLVQAISKVVQFRKTGIYHIGGKNFMNRFEFTKEIADYFDLDFSLVKPITTESLKQPAKRPLKSGLITIKAESEFGYKATELKKTFEIMQKELNLKV